MSPTKFDTITIDAVSSTSQLKAVSPDFASDITYTTVAVSELASTFGDYTGKFETDIGKKSYQQTVYSHQQMINFG